MNMVLQKISQLRAVPVIAIDDAAKAVSLAHALVAGGLPVAEVTFRTAAGEKAIRQISQNCPDVLVGAGTVITMDQCVRAVNAGAKFIVSPGYSEEIVSYCMNHEISVLPGCTNATDMMRAINAGLEVVKFFPAEQSGGISFLNAIAPVFPQLKFMPTGGVNLKNLPEYLRLKCVVACGGTWMVKKEFIENKQWDEVTNICRKTAAILSSLAKK